MLTASIVSQTMSRRCERGTRHKPALRFVLVVAFALATTPLGSAATPPAKSGHYLGKTSERAVASLPQATSVSFTVSTNGTEILNLSASLGYNGVCGQGGGPEYKVAVPVITLGLGGQFAASTQGVFHTLRMAIRIAGNVSGVSAHGTIAAIKLSCPPPSSTKNPYSETFTAATR